MVSFNKNSKSEKGCKKPNPGPAYSWPMGGWFSAFFIIPIVIIIMYSFCAKDIFGGIKWEFSLDAYKSIFAQIDGKFLYIPLLWRTLWTAAIATLACIIIAIPCGYAMARSKRQTLFLILIIIPFLTNSLIRIFAWKTILGEQGFINSILAIFSAVHSSSGKFPIFARSLK